MEQEAKRMRRPRTSALVGLAAAELVLLALGATACGGDGAPEPPQGRSAPDAVANGAVPAAAPGEHLRVERAVILDPTGFEAPMAAATVFLPLGWKGEGGVSWGQEHMCTNGYAFRWQASSPDGLTRVALLPQEGWEWQSDGSGALKPGCAVRPFRDVRSYMEDIVRRVRPEARVVGFRPREDLRAGMGAKLDSHTPMPMGESRTWVEAGEITVEYDEDGVAKRGSVTSVVVFNLMRTDFGMGMHESLGALTFPSFAASAPRDAFDPAFFEAIRRSIRLDQRWERLIAGHDRVMARDALRSAQERSRIVSETNAEIARIRDEAWKAGQESSDRRFREFSETIRDVETYADPLSSTGEVELSSFYEHAWRMSDGTYVLTNDPGFEPYRQLGLDGERLDPQR